MTKSKKRIWKKGEDLCLNLPAMGPLCGGPTFYHYVSQVGKNHRKFICLRTGREVVLSHETIDAGRVELY